MKSFTRALKKKTVALQEFNITAFLENPQISCLRTSIKEYQSFYKTLVGLTFLIMTTQFLNHFFTELEKERGMTLY